MGWLGGWPASSLTMAAAHTLACALAENADFGMPPAMVASPSTWMLGTRLDSNVTGSIGHQPVASATPATSAMRPAFCGGMTLATAALCLPKSVTSVISRDVDRGDLAALGQRHPFQVVGIELLPGVLEQPLLGEGVLGVEHDQLRLRLPGLEVVGDQAGALVGAGRAAERIGRRRHDDDAAVLHGLELAAQQQRLLAGLPGVRHLLGGRLVVARQAVPADVDAGRHDQAVVGERGRRYRA